jgi:hypothetical protein
VIVFFTHPSFNPVLEENTMWKCQYCEKTNFDDQKICPYCSAPNPAASRASFTSAGSNAQPPYGQNQPAQDWNARYNPGATKKSKFSAIFHYAIVGIAAVLLIVILVMLFQKPAPSGQAAAAPQKTEVALKGAVQEIPEAAPAETPAPTATAEPMQEPFTAEAPVDIYLNFGETYDCTAEDFDLPYAVANDEINWRCEDNDAGTICSSRGHITAGNYQVDPANKYNDAITITGKTKNGSTLTYTLLTGSGENYTFDWSTSPRTMKGYSSGYVIVADEMVPQCSGFTLYYEYTLKDGDLNSDRWSVWVREDGSKWVRVDDIYLENTVGKQFDIEFDRPITFNEICVQPETYSDEYSCTTSYAIGYLLFN